MIDPRRWRTDREGIALAIVVLVVVVIAGITAAAAIVGANVWLINRYDTRQSVLEAVADAGLAEARARINGNPDIYPDSGYVLLEDSAAVEDANAQPIPGVHRYTYVGPTGATTGQYGVFGSIVVVAEDEGGTRVIRRREINQESFAKFAYFTDEEPDNIAFGGGDQIFGPVHTNDELKIYSSGATFHGPVTTADEVQGEDYGDFRQGYTEHVPAIPMPDMADVTAMQAYADGAGMAFTADDPGQTGHANMRIEFIWADLDGDLEPGAGEGFIRIYESDDARWVVADVPEDYWGPPWEPYDGEGLRGSINCGHFHTDANGDNVFASAASHVAGAWPDDWVASVNNSDRRCFLGGADSMATNAVFDPDDGRGQWRQWVEQIPEVDDAGRDDAGYLFPISRELNANFKGVVFVDGPVAVSGVVRGHVTLVATGDIIIADDLTYATDPGDDDRRCTDGDGSNDDVLGLFSGGDIIVADNTLNAPWRPELNGGPGNNFRSYDDTREEKVHATLLTLGSFRVQNHDDYQYGPTMSEPCGSQPWGRGCLFLTGGIVQRTRGPVGTAAGSGYIKRYSYDGCVTSSPPPYFPTTGRFSRSRYFEVDPVGFDPAELFDLLTPNG